MCTIFFVCMCMCRCAYMCVDICVEARGQLWVSSSIILYLIFLRKGLLLYLELCIWLDLCSLGCTLQGSFCYWLPSAGITGTFCMPSFLVWMPGIQVQVLKLWWSVLYWLCHFPSPSQIIFKVKVLAEMYFIIYLFYELIGSEWHSCVMSIALFKKSRSKISRMMVNYLKSQYKRETTFLSKFDSLIVKFYFIEKIIF